MRLHPGRATTIYQPVRKEPKKRERSGRIVGGLCPQYSQTPIVKKVEEREKRFTGISIQDEEKKNKGLRPARSSLRRTKEIGGSTSERHLGGECCKEKSGSQPHNRGKTRGDPSLAKLIATPSAPQALSGTAPVPAIT